MSWVAWKRSHQHRYGIVYGTQCTRRRRYNVVNFLPKPHKLGRGMGCILWVQIVIVIIYAMPCYIVPRYYPTLAREFQGFRVWGKFVFRTLELTDTPTNLANQVKVGHALDQSRSVQSRGPERAHQNNEPSWRSLRTDRRLSRQFWDDK